MVARTRTHLSLFAMRSGALWTSDRTRCRASAASKGSREEQNVGEKGVQEEQVFMHRGLISRMHVYVGVCQPYI